MRAARPGVVGPAHEAGLGPISRNHVQHLGMLGVRLGVSCSSAGRDGWGRPRPASSPGELTGRVSTTHWLRQAKISGGGGAYMVEIFTICVLTRALEAWPEEGGGGGRGWLHGQLAGWMLAAGHGRAAPWARRRRAAPSAPWTRVVPGAILALLRGWRVHAPEVAGRPRHIVHRLVWFVSMIAVNGLRRFEAWRGFCAQWTRPLRVPWLWLRGGRGGSAVPSRVWPAMASWGAQAWTEPYDHSYKAF